MSRAESVHLHMHDLSVLSRPYTENQPRDLSPPNELHPEAEVVYRGEAMDPFDSLATFFEANSAITEQAPSGETAAPFPPPSMHPRMSIFPTSATCYGALMRSRGACLRDILSAVSKHAEG
eukprot:CAMPEP_0114141400 /NCGR_PEP_ID=MMETSP0043_2-20121206/17887_1 /TAXON_ID=464988 /ORGANISM="Hemiselmis andersenii, Strain CCMP644" /LENGTH=120 /DNA_ID=CAMNT_0001235537 /DNA_START=184 /DNA_END=543 /DNA_ORIENTATION=-